MPQKSFGKRFDHFNHSENNLQPYFHQQIFFLESEISKLENNFYFWIYVIFMEVFEVNKSLQHGVQDIGHIILHSTNNF